MVNPSVMSLCKFMERSNLQIKILAHLYTLIRIWSWKRHIFFIRSILPIWCILLKIRLSSRTSDLRVTTPRKKYFQCTYDIHTQGKYSHSVNHIKINDNNYVIVLDLVRYSKSCIFEFFGSWLLALFSELYVFSDKRRNL